MLRCGRLGNRKPNGEAQAFRTARKHRVFFQGRFCKAAIRGIQATLSDVPSSLHQHSSKTQAFSSRCALYLFLEIVNSSSTSPLDRDSDRSTERCKSKASSFRSDTLETSNPRPTHSRRTSSKKSCHWGGFVLHPAPEFIGQPTSNLHAVIVGPPNYLTA